jgi:hypothetical protein
MFKLCDNFSLLHVFFLKLSNYYPLFKILIVLFRLGLLFNADLFYLFTHFFGLFGIGEREPNKTVRDTKVVEKFMCSDVDAVEVVIHSAVEEALARDRMVYP